MKKQSILIAGISVVVLVGIIVIAAGRQSSAGTQPLPDHYAAAKKLPITGKCLSKNPAVTIPSGQQTTIEMAAIAQLMDVPAGTNVDVNYASYSADEITGSDIYPAQYGSYNFTLTKRGNDWVTTKFEHCN